MWILLLLLGTGILDVPISLLNSAVINGMWSFVKSILRVGFVTTGGGTDDLGKDENGNCSK